MTHEKTGRVTTDMPNADRSARSMRNGRAADSQINFVLVTGRRLSLTPIQIWRLMTDQHFLIYFGISSVLITYLYPVQLQPSPPWWEFVIVFSAMALFFYCILVGTLLLIEKCCRRWPRLIVPVPLITLIALLATLGFARVYNPIMVGPVWSNFRPLTEEFVLIYFVILNLEILFSIFVLSHTKVFIQATQLQSQREAPAAAELRVAADPAEALPGPPQVVLQPPAPQPPAAPQAAPLPAPMARHLPVPILRQPPRPPQPPVPPPPRAVRFGSYSWPVTALRLIRAEEHYIRVVTKEQEVLVRYRLSDAVTQLPEDAGMRVHRSYWLSYDAIVEHAPLPDSRLLLTLWNGTTVTVPRAHRKRLEAAFAARRQATGQG